MLCPSAGKAGMGLPGGVGYGIMRLNRCDAPRLPGAAKRSGTEMEQEMLQQALAYGRQFVRYGKPAGYIPELAAKDPSRLGAAMCDMKGNLFTAGDCGEKFSMQSISKVIALLLALEQNGFDGVFCKVGLEPTGDAFNSTVRLDHLTNNKPFNPMINAGAIAVTSTIRGATLEQRKQVSLAYARRLLGNPELDADYEVFLSESRTGFKNRAIIYLMRSNGIIEGSCEEHLELYFYLCSLACTCKDLAVFAATLSNNGVSPVTGEVLIPPNAVKLARSLMVTCGMYDYSGEFAATVGMPSKSGVGGGIISCPIGRYGIAVYGPALDEKGNSIGGVKILEYLSGKMDLNMF